MTKTKDQFRKSILLMMADLGNLNSALLNQNYPEGYCSEDSEIVRETKARSTAWKARHAQSELYNLLTMLLAPKGLNDGSESMKLNASHYEITKNRTIEEATEENDTPRNIVIFNETCVMKGRRWSSPDGDSDWPVDWDEDTFMDVYGERFPDGDVDVVTVGEGETEDSKDQFRKSILLMMADLGNLNSALLNQNYTEGYCSEDSEIVSLSTRLTWLLSQRFPDGDVDVVTVGEGETEDSYFQPSLQDSYSIEEQRLAEELHARDCHQDGVRESFGMTEEDDGTSGEGE